MGKKKNKICLIQTNSYHLFNKKKGPAGSQGGAEIQLYFWARELAKDKNFDVSFVVGDFGQKEIEKIEGVKIYKAVTPKEESSFLRKIFQAIKFWKIFKKVDADVYITSTKNNIVLLASFFCKIKNKKHIHRTAHEEEVGLIDSKKNWLSKMFFESLKKANEVIVQNKSHQRKIKKNYNINSRVVKNFFEIKEERKKEKNFVFWLGRSVAWKKPEFFLQLAKEFPGENFVMVYNKCEGGQRRWSRINAEVEKIKNLKLFEKIPFAEIQDYFDRAKVFVSTSDAEGFPNTFIQAGTGKTPILSLNVNPDDFITKYNVGNFAGGDFGEMKDQLGELLGNESKWKEKSRNVFLYVKENHDLKRNMPKIRKIMKDVLDR